MEIILEPIAATKGYIKAVVLDGDLKLGSIYLQKLMTGGYNRPIDSSVSDTPK